MPVAVLPPTAAKRIHTTADLPATAPKEVTPTRTKTSFRQDRRSRSAGCWVSCWARTKRAASSSITTSVLPSSSTIRKVRRQALVTEAMGLRLVATTLRREAQVMAPMVQLTGVTEATAEDTVHRRGMGLVLDLRLRWAWGEVFLAAC